VHRIPSPAPASPSSAADTEDLESPRLGQAVASRSNGGRRSRKQAGGVVADARATSRPRSPKPSRATVLGSTHAHSILHTCLIQGPPSPDNAFPQPQPSSSIPLPLPQPSSSVARSSSPFRGFESPSMTTNEMQVGGQAVCLFLRLRAYSHLCSPAVPVESGNGSDRWRARPRGKQRRVHPPSRVLAFVTHEVVT
jgi:hypothetical protein